MGDVAKALLILLLPAVVAVPARATEELAARTGKRCAACHADPAGGGPLTAEGEAYREADRPAPSVLPRGTAGRVVRFAAGFLHVLVGVLWFGTILYVHLLLKPAYAAKGLPRGELMVGWISIVAIAATGLVLAAYRVPSPKALVTTRFGVLLSIKVALYLVMVATAFIVTFVVGPRLRKKAGPVDASRHDPTPEELSRCDGKEGRPAWFAYKGQVYDATGNRLWRGGVHVGRHPAGADLTDALKHAPHGEEKVLGLPRVGALIPPGAPVKRPLHEKGFFFMTYLNLGLVVAILFIISLWRWW